MPTITSVPSFGLLPVFLFIWMSGVMYAIFRYRFMTISLEHVSRVVIENIDEMIILLDPAGKLVKWQVVILTVSLGEFIYGKKTGRKFL